MSIYFSPQVHNYSRGMYESTNNTYGLGPNFTFWRIKQKFFIVLGNPHWWQQKILICQLLKFTFRFHWKKEKRKFIKYTKTSNLNHFLSIWRKEFSMVKELTLQISSLHWVTNSEEPQRKARNFFSEQSKKSRIVKIIGCLYLSALIK